MGQRNTLKKIAGTTLIGGSLALASHQTPFAQYVGIGTQNPQARLHIRVPQGFNAPFLQVDDQNGTVFLIVDAQGNVGIHTSNPTHALHIAGQVRIDQFTNAAPAALLYISQNPPVIGQLALPGDSSRVLQGNGTWGLPDAWLLTGNAGTSPAQNFLGTKDNADLVIRTNNTERMRITASGQIGVNNPNPQGILDVRGNGMYVTGTGGNFNTINTLADLVAFTDDNLWVLNLYATGNANHGALYIRVEGNSPQSNTTNTMPALEIDHYGQGPALLITSYNNTVDSAYPIRAQTSVAKHTAFLTNSINTTNASVIFARQDGGNCTNGCKSVYGEIINSGVGNGTGVYGYGGWAGIIGRALNPNANNSWAARFIGNVRVLGNFSATGAKSFVIDHPIEPDRRFLLHFAIESPEVLNVYRGRITTNDQGFAEITLPAYFWHVNTEPTYYLTPIGAGVRVWVEQEPTPDNPKLIIRSEQGHVQVAWMIVARRNDPYLRAHPVEAEPLKPPAFQGYYLHPELYGAPPEKRIGWEEDQPITTPTTPLQGKPSQTTDNPSTP